MLTSLFAHDTFLTKYRDGISIRRSLVFDFYDIVTRLIPVLNSYSNLITRISHIIVFATLAFVGNVTERIAADNEKTFRSLGNHHFLFKAWAVSFCKVDVVPGA